MIDDELAARVLQLYQVGNLSIRQIADYCGMCRKTVSRLICTDGKLPARSPGETLVSPYRRLLESWYAEHPKLKASQVHARLRELGFTGSRATVERATKKLRAKKPVMFHERVLLPAEEAQVDWMVLSLPWGTVYGFVYILAWSRYLVVRFYPRMTFEFFLDGHLEAFRECVGVAHALRYDNLKSVVISRKPVLRLNAQFVDFARHYGFAIHPCTPYRPNEKGRVERVIRDIRSFLYDKAPRDLPDLNRLVKHWCGVRNNTPHSMTGRSPGDATFDEPLKKLPAISYPARRSDVAKVSKTGFVEVDGNRYSVPSRYSNSFGKWYQRFNRRYITKDPLKVYHSMRHTVTDTLKQAGILETIIAELVEHSNGGSETMERYGKRYQPKVLLEALKKLDYGVELSKLIFI